jgi:3-dehydroquinate dehydratase type I
MLKPKLCAVLTNTDAQNVKVANKADIIEIRIDMVGSSWPNLLKVLKRPWIACNRLKDEGGFWTRNEKDRIKELLKAASLGASFIDIELNSPDTKNVVELVKKADRKALVSFHDFKGTPRIGKLREIVKKQIGLGADLCKVVVMAEKFQDNLTILRLLQEFTNSTHIIAFCMGEKGGISRVLSPLFGSDFAYVSTGVGLESAGGQIELNNFRSIYKMFDSKLKPCDIL